MNFEELNGVAELNGDGQPRIVPVMVAESISPSDSNAQKTAVLMSTAALTVPDEKIAVFIKFAITRIVSESLTLIDLVAKTQIKKVDEPLVVSDFNFSTRVKLLAESVVLGDTRFTTQIKYLSEALSLLDTFIANKIAAGGLTTKVMTDTLALTDLRFSTQIKVLGEAVVLGDFRSTKQLKKLAESLVMFEEILKTLVAHGQITRVMTENIVVQVVQTYQKIWKVLTTKELTIYDQDRNFSYNIRCNEALTAVENFIKTINAKPPPIRIVTMEDDIKIFNSFLIKTYSRVVIDELISTADDFPYWVMRCANLVDNLTVFDNILSAKVTRIKTMVLTESLALDATFILRKLKIMTENLALVDSGAQKTQLVTVSATVTPFDVFIKNALAGGRVFVNVVNDGITLSDGTAQWVYRHREFIDALTVSDSLLKWRVLMQLVSEVTTLTDTVVKAFGPSLFLKIMSEGIVLVDPTYAVKYAYRRLDEPLAVVDQETDVVWSVRVPSETISVVDSTGQARVVSRVQAETLALTDASIAYALRQKIMVESLALVDVLTRQQLQMRIVTDPTAVTDQQLHGLLRYQVASESIVLTDAQASALAKLRTLTESVVLQDGSISVKIARRNVVELLGIQDEALPTSIVYVTLIVRNTLSASPSPVLGVDNTNQLGSDPSTVIH